MATNNLGEINQVTPTDGKKINEFNYVQVGVTGTVAVRFKGGPIKSISSNLLDRMALVPVGVMDEVLNTGTTATDIYVW